jgi:RNAse (barnase) inhibitor barstar
MIFTQSLARISWECVHFEPDLDVTAMALALLEHGIRLFQCSALGIETKEQLLDIVASAMEFPDYFGKNWDALSDCLGDMMWAPAAGYGLVIRDAEALWRQQTLLAGKLVEIWLFVAEYWSKQGRPFHLVFLR